MSEFLPVEIRKSEIQKENVNQYTREQLELLKNCSHGTR